MSSLPFPELATCHPLTLTLFDRGQIYSFSPEVKILNDTKSTKNYVKLYFILEKYEIHENS